MQVVVLTGLGKVDKLKFDSLDIPTPAKDEALIKILYCGINHLDILIRSGKRPGPKSFPHILGSEIVGQTQDGKKVVVYPWLQDGGTIGRTCWGGYAEYAAVPKRNLVKIPSGLKLAEVCALTLAGTTAHHLVRRAKIKDKSRVLVTGATGGVGIALVQILKSKKCEIICVTSHQNKISLLKKLGADKVILTKNMVSQKGLEYAVDLVGGSLWSAVLETLG
ncbi:MAG: zinc-binding alcohol dehydrogenase family protein [Candidatus Daviesbacteria bacterium]|nr:zinc-binding alcohol dehydrogenase family protein [Candidatus Daviesbacteria bacterium]